MRSTRVTSLTEHAIGTFALLLIGIVGAALDAFAFVRRPIRPAASHNAQAMPIDRCEIS